MYVIVSTESSGVRTQWHAVGRTLADRAVFIRDWERQTVPLFSTALRPYGDKNRKARQSNAAHPGCTRASEIRTAMRQSVTSFEVPLGTHSRTSDTRRHRCGSARALTRDADTPLHTGGTRRHMHRAICGSPGQSPSVGCHAWPSRHRQRRSRG